MTPRAVRRAERTVHLLWGALIALEIYGLLPAWGGSILRWIVVPGIAASGFAMWFAAPLRRFAKRVWGSAPRLGRSPSHPAA